MASLTDYYTPGALGMPTEQTGALGMFGSNPQAWLGLASGLMGAPSGAIGLQRGFQGMAEGMAGDEKSRLYQLQLAQAKLKMLQAQQEQTREATRRKALTDYLTNDPSVDPRIKALAATDPDAAYKMMEPLKLGAGDSLYNPITKQPMFTAPDKPPSSVKEFEYSQEHPGFVTYQQSLKPQTNISIDQKAESAFERKYGEIEAGEAGKINTLASEAIPSMQKSALLGRLLDQEVTGKKTPAVSTMGAWLQSFNINPAIVGIDPNLPATAQAINGLANDMLAGKIGKGGIPANNFSEADREFILTTIPQLGDTPEAAKVKLEVSRRIDQLALARADAWTKARDEGKSYDKFESEWRKNMGSIDLFADLGQTVKGGPQGGVSALRGSVPTPSVTGGGTVDWRNYFGTQ